MSNSERPPARELNLEDAKKAMRSLIWGCAMLLVLVLVHIVLWIFALAWGWEWPPLYPIFGFSPPQEFVPILLITVSGVLGLLTLAVTLDDLREAMYYRPIWSVAIKELERETFKRR